VPFPIRLAADHGTERAITELGRARLPVVPISSRKMKLALAAEGLFALMNVVSTEFPAKRVALPRELLELLDSLLYLALVGLRFRSVTQSFFHNRRPSEIIAPMDFFLERLRKPRASASGLAPGGQPRAAVPTCITATSVGRSLSGTTRSTCLCFGLSVTAWDRTGRTWCLLRRVGRGRCNTPCWWERSWRFCRRRR
jgi:hypothetical protein